MKKICLLLLFFLLTLTVANADNVRFDNMRTVVIANTTQNNYPARYMKRALIQPFRIPYWDRIESSAILSPSDVTEENLRAISAQYNADVVLVPVVQTGTGVSSWEAIASATAAKRTPNTATV